MPSEESLRLPKFFVEKTPKPAATHLAARAVKAQHEALGMLFSRLADGRVDAEPVANSGHLAERHANLCHAEGPGVHA